MPHGRALGALLLFALLLSAAIAAPHPVPAPTPAPGPGANAAAVVERGRYLVTIAGCNDCHTPGWRESDGTIPARDWLTGSRVGFRGVHSMMNWGDVRAFTPADRHAVYTFIRSLGPTGPPSLPDVKPWDEPHTPYIDLREHLPRHSSITRNHDYAYSPDVRHLLTRGAPLGE